MMCNKAKNSILLFPSKALLVFAMISRKHQAVCVNEGHVDRHAVLVDVYVRVFTCLEAELAFV